MLDHAPLGTLKAMPQGAAPACEESIALLPEFVLADDRALVGPFALYAPRPLPWSVTRWSGVLRGDPTVRVVVLTASCSAELSLWRNGRPEELWLHGQTDADGPAWLARRAHPGVRLDELLRREAGRRPPPVLGLAVAHALSGRVSGRCVARSPADVIVGVDGVVTADGLDGDGVARPQLPTGDEATARAAVLLAALTGDAACVGAVDAHRPLLERIVDIVRGRDAHTLAEDRAQLAAVVRGVCPDVAAVAETQAELLGLLGARAFEAWPTEGGVERLRQVVAFTPLDAAMMKLEVRVVLEETRAILGGLPGAPPPVSPKPSPRRAPPPRQRHEWLPALSRSRVFSTFRSPRSSSSAR